MSLFRVHPNQPFEGPHQGQPVASSGVPLSEADAAVILVHGRGATAQSMLKFAGEFDVDGISYLAPQAFRYAWYPLSFLAPVEDNEPGISSGLQAIYDVIQSLLESGLSKKQIALLGFSQGACLALEFAARHPDRFGAIMGLSGGLIGPELDSSTYNGSLIGTPTFLGCSDDDPHIPEERIHQTADIFTELKADVTKRIYPGLGHSVNQDEINVVSDLFRRIIEKE